MANHFNLSQILARGTWVLLGGTVILGCVSVFALRSNNQTMLSLRQAVYTADKNNTNVQAALDRLQSYVLSHMNTDLSAGPNAVYPPIQLTYTYQRLVAAESSQIAADNSALYTEAQNYCQAQDPTDFSGHNRVPCIENYVTNHGASLQTISPSLYEFDFISPRWTPDLAGWSLVATLLTGILTTVSFVFRRRSRRTLKQK